MEQYDDMLIRHKCFETFFAEYIKDKKYIHKLDDGLYDEMTFHINNKILAKIFWLGRNRALRIYKFKKILEE